MTAKFPRNMATSSIHLLGLTVLYSLSVLLAADETSHSGAGPGRDFWREDAALRDVQWVGSKIVWGVGERGTILRSNDAGETWVLQNSGTDAQLSSICALTNEIAWAAGSRFDSPALPGRGILLETRDGGMTWKELSSGRLPPLAVVRFFDLEHGIAVASQESASRSGVLQTSDQGKTWKALPGPDSPGWTHGVLIDSELGILVGRGGRIALVDEGEFRQITLGGLSQRTIRQVVIASNGRSWLVGDGGLIMTSSGGGVSWETPTGELPDAIRNVANFRAIETQGDNVWLAGDPGGVIWHSADAGTTWNRQTTGETVPLNRIRMLNPRIGVAVGSMGLILKTQDGGLTWKAVRGADHHAASLSLLFRRGQLPGRFLAKNSAELGYRAAVWQIIPSEDGAAGGHTDEDDLCDQVNQRGGEFAGISWQLALTAPGLEFDRAALIDHWRRRTEGKLGAVLVGSIVRSLRTWRPEVITIDQPFPDDAVGNIVYEALQKALVQAADSEQFTEHIELGGLRAWQVDRVWVRLPEGSQGIASLDAFESLPRMRSTLHSLGDGTSFGHLQGSGSRIGVTKESWRMNPERTQVADFWQDLRIAPGTATRRKLVSINEAALQQALDLGRKQQRFVGIVTGSVNNEVLRRQLPAQLSRTLAGWPEGLARDALRDVIQDYRQHGEYQLAETVCLELIRQSPDSPVTHEAYQWLFHYLSSSEMAWQWARRGGAASQKQQGEASDVPGAPPRLERKDRPATLRMDTGDRQNVETIASRQSRADELAAQLKELSPQLAASNSIQFPLVALHRTRGKHALADELLHAFELETPGNLRRSISDREQWLINPVGEPPYEFVRSRRARQRPHLDGVLGDDCWLAARELILVDANKPAPARKWDAETATWKELNPQSQAREDKVSIFMMCHDKEHLYLAGSMPHRGGAPVAPIELAGRTYDAALEQHDRIAISLDKDRDLTTSYLLEIDHRGWCRDSCWEDYAWNPKWYIAASSDEQRWRFEAAIPWSELTPQAPEPGETWAVSIRRIIPSVRLETWVQPAGLAVQPGSYGYVQFER